MERRLLAGRYGLEEQLGPSTWRATDTELGREVLVRLGGAPEAGAALSHGSIVRVFEQGEADGERFAVLEYLPGGTLAERGSLSETAAADVAAALAYAHEAGVVHGALDADAILFDAEGRAKVTGFRGAGEPAADVAALDALRGRYEAEAATLIQRPPAPPPQPPRSRRTAVVIAAAVLLALAGIAAAVLATSDDSPAEEPTTSLSVPAPTTASTETAEEPAPPPSTTEPTTTTSDTQPPPTTLPPPTTDGPLPTVPTVPPTLPPEPTEPPPTITEPPPTTEPPPPTTTEEPLPPTTTEG